MTAPDGEPKHRAPADPSSLIPSGVWQTAVIRPRAHVWVKDGVPTLTVITNAPDDLSMDWPDDAGPVVIFDAGFDITITEIQT